jgi:hypothetical protein
MINVKTMGMFSPTIPIHKYISPGCVCVSVYLWQANHPLLSYQRSRTSRVHSSGSSYTVQFLDVLANHGQIYFVALKSLAAFRKSWIICTGNIDIFQSAKYSTMGGEYSVYSIYIVTDSKESVCLFLVKHNCSVGANERCSVVVYNLCLYTVRN